MLAHQTEAMARQKTLKPLAKYLEPPPKKQGEAAVMAMMRQLHERKG